MKTLKCIHLNLSKDFHHSFSLSLSLLCFSLPPSIPPLSLSLSHLCFSLPLSLPLFSLSLPGPGNICSSVHSQGCMFHGSPGLGCLSLSLSLPCSLSLAPSLSPLLSLSLSIPCSLSLSLLQACVFIPLLPCLRPVLDAKERENDERTPGE